LSKLSPELLEISPLNASPLPISIELVKTHLAVDDIDSDALIEMYTLAAIRWAETFMRRTIYARSHSWVLKDFPRGHDQRIWLPRGKTQSVESIVYTNGGSATTLTGPSSGSPAGTDFAEDLRGNSGGYVLPLSGQAWPAADCDAASPVVINFTAGWLTGEIPDDIIHGILFAVSDAFDSRGTADLTQGRNFSTREALISPYRLHRFYR
jgi:uncharacterized phiE125 gp8 family phage protein